MLSTGSQQTSSAPSRSRHCARVAPANTPSKPLHGVIRLGARGEGEVTELVDVEQLAQPCPELGLQRRDGDPAVRAAVHVVARVRSVEQHRAGPGRAPRACGGDVRRHPAEHAVEHRHVAVASLTGLLGTAQGGEDGDDGALRAAAEVGHLHAGDHGPSISVAGEGEHARARQVVEVVAGAQPIRPILAKTGDAAGHQSRVARAQRGGVEAEPVHHAGPEALEDDVRARHQLEEQLATARCLEVEAQRALVAVDGGEHRRAALVQRRHPAHVVAAVEVLDLDDVGAEAGEDHGGERTGQKTAEVEDAHTAEGHRVASVMKRWLRRSVAVVDSKRTRMVSNADVVRTLERIADLLEIRGENTFKVRAYRLAASQVENLGRSLHDIAASDGGLRSVAGFGAAIADKMSELIATGRSSYLERLEAEIPPTLLDILAIPGMGPRTVATLWREAGITTVDELEAAARRGGLDGLPRLGARSADRIVAALEARSARGGEPPRRRPRAEVAPLVDRLRGSVVAPPWGGSRRDRRVVPQGARNLR